MATKHAKYGKGYETPNGLQEDNYYEMMYDLMNYVNKKGLTTRQAQSLFTDCADMILDVKPIKSENTTQSDMDRLIDKLDQIKLRLEDIPRYRNIYNLDNSM